MDFKLKDGKDFGLKTSAFRKLLRASPGSQASDV